MPWSKEDYPNSMKNLPDATRNKAIEIANALLKDGKPEDEAIPIAISRAKKWAQNPNKEANFQLSGLTKVAVDWRKLEK